MPGTWSINGGAGDATINEYGVAFFPENRTDNDITYTINYASEYGCTAQTTCTVLHCSCDCNDLNLYGSEFKFGVNGGIQVLGEFDPNCANKFEIVGALGWLDVYVTGNSIVASASTNPDPYERTIGVNVKIGDTVCGEPTFLIKQEANEVIYNIHIYGVVTGGLDHSDPYQLSIGYDRTGTPAEILSQYKLHTRGTGTTEERGLMTVSYYDCQGGTVNTTYDVPQTLSVCPTVGESGIVQTRTLLVDSICANVWIEGCSDGEVNMCSHTTNTYTFTSANGNVKFNVVMSKLK